MTSKLKIILLVFIISSNCFSQNRQGDKVSGSFRDLPLISILDSLSNQTDYFFSYNSSILEGTGRFTISANDKPIDQFLSELLVGTGIEYSFFKDQIILNYKKVEEVSKKKNHFILTGIVKDEKGNPLQNANVFLDGTTIGTSSDGDGLFKLESIPPGFYNLVFSHIGFENAVYSISEYNGGSRIQNHQMEIDLNQLQEVEINSNRITKNKSEWHLNFLSFRKELLGNSENTRSCVIENPEVINFYVDEKRDLLRAYASEPIQIRNDALGYKITYFLESFEMSPNDLRFRGQIKFRNANPIRNSEKREWNRNRSVSFNGSFNHFRNALLDNKLKEEGFRIYHLNDLNELKNGSRHLKKIQAEDIIVFKGDHYELGFNNFILVEFHKEKESINFLADIDFSSILYEKNINSSGIVVKNPSHQISIIKLLKNSVRLDLNGQIEDKFSLTTYGYWSWERLADLVPINYDPKLDKL